MRAVSYSPPHAGAFVSSKRPYRAPFGALWAVLGSSAKYLSKSPCKDLSCLAPLHINGGSSCEYPHTGGQVHVPPQAERGKDFTGLVEAVQCSCTSMAQCMRHATLDIFTPSCLDMHGEYILTEDIKVLLCHVPCLTPGSRLGYFCVSFCKCSSTPAKLGDCSSLYPKPLTMYILGN
jgi:hypothetical protein